MNLMLGLILIVCGIVALLIPEYNSKNKPISLAGNQSIKSVDGKQYIVTHGSNFDIGEEINESNSK